MRGDRAAQLLGSRSMSGSPHRADVLVVALLAACLVVPALAAASHGGIHVPEARVGDQALYLPAGDAPGAFSFEWLERETTLDRWGRPLQAHVLRTLVPAAELSKGAPADTWMELREAFAGLGRDPLWRLQAYDTSWPDNTQWLVLPWTLIGAPATRETVREDNVTWGTYAPASLLRTCLARHALQGRSLGADTLVPLTTLCPGMAGRALEAEAQPARGTSFLGRQAVELRYEVRAEDKAVGDLSLPPSGILRVVLADGISYMVEAEARNDQGERVWGFTLGGFQAGTGATVPPGRDDGGEEPAGRDASYRPLGPAGPQDGGAGLDYRLDEALANLRRDPALLDFQNWERAHPDAFVLRAELAMGESAEGYRYAAWTITFGTPRPGSGGRFEVFLVASVLQYSEELPRPGGRPAGPVSNYRRGPTVADVEAVRPGGELSMDLASAVRVSNDQVSMEFRGAEVSRIDYQAPGPGRPALLGVQRQLGHDVGDDVSKTTVVLDASTGAARNLALYHRHTRYGDLAVNLGLAAVAGEAHSAALPGLSGVGVAGVTLLAMLAAVLAHAGYLTVLYSRLRQSDLLDNAARRRIYDLVQEKPGIHFKAVASALGIGRGATMYHLRVLERGGLLTRVSLRGWRRYYLTGTVPHRELRGKAVLESPSARTVYEAVRREPGLTVAELARRVEVSRPAAHKAVERLRAAGLLEKVPEGRVVRVTAREPGFQN